MSIDPVIRELQSENDALRERVTALTSAIQNAVAGDLAWLMGYTEQHDPDAYRAASKVRDGLARALLVGEPRKHAPTCSTGATTGGFVPACDCGGALLVGEPAEEP